MNPLAGQIYALLDQLRRVESTLKDVERADPGLHRRVHVYFENEVRKQSEALGKELDRLDQKKPLETIWAKVSDTRRECVPLFQECLALAQAAFIRGTWVDRIGAEGDPSLCQLADGLLEEVNDKSPVTWKGFTLLDDKEFIARASDIIRVSFPEVSLWNLPVAAHEFGHFIGPALTVKEPDGRTGLPFQKFLDEERIATPELSPAQLDSYLHEHFADVFACYSVGPAYACTCILLRFDPVTARKLGGQHPSPACRVHLIFDVLRKMDEDPSGGMSVIRFEPFLSYLQNTWEGSLDAAGVPKEIGSEDVKRLHRWFRRMYHLVSDHLSTCRYRGWLRAKELARDLHDDRAAPAFTGKENLADVLNAAWICRLERETASVHEVEQIGRRAIGLCRQILDHRHREV